MLLVSDVLKIKGDQVWQIEATASIRDALKLLAEKDIGTLLVMQGDTIAGIFSERDFARRLARDESFNPVLPISELMTKTVITVSPSDDIEHCMQLMTDKHIRHLPVVDGDRLVGLISIGDVVKHIIVYQKQFIKQLEDYIHGHW
jgi:CBS domain-containing protein